jgi:glutamate-1-semialdehyde 2,1-aminomutase
VTDLKQSARLYERALAVSPGGVHSPVRSFRDVGGTPVFTERAAGSTLFDVDGNHYIDFCMSWGPLIFGHADADIATAAKHAIDRGSSFGTAEAGSLRLAELITGEIPWVDKVRFVNSGTEAVMGALRVARAATGRDKILKFAGCYHGHADSMLVSAGSGLAGQAVADSAGVPAAAAADTLVAPLDDLPAVEAIFAQHVNCIAAIIVEPLPANFGLLPQREGYLASLADIAHRNGALLIFDEVITGFRLAFGGGAEKYGVTPDLVTYGKIIGGGFPVGAYGGRGDLMDLVAPQGPVYQAGTLSANPVAMAAGHATLSRLLSEPPYALLESRLQSLTNEINHTPTPIGGTHLQLVSAGSMFWPAFRDAETGSSVVRSPDTIPGAQKELFPTLFRHLLERGFYIAPSPFEVGFLSTAHTERELNAFADAIGALADSAR